MKKLAISGADTYVHRNKKLRRTKESPMIAAIEKFFDALFAPLARELARMPASAFRHVLGGF